MVAGQVNVFIDGVSLKSNIQQGGIVGQDASRGNPFGQDTIQEFRVDTQNYKAEYELAGSAIITAITRSGHQRVSRRRLRAVRKPGLGGDQLRRPDSRYPEREISR